MCIRDSIQAAQEKNSSTENTVYTYFEDELTDQIINDLMNIKGYTKKQATNLLYSGGLKVYTTQDSKIQNILDEEYADPSNYPDTVQYELDYALTVTDPDAVSYTHLKAITEGTNGRAKMKKEKDLYYSVIDGEVKVFTD